MENVSEQILETVKNIEDLLNSFLPLLGICALLLCGVCFVKWVTRL